MCPFLCIQTFTLDKIILALSGNIKYIKRGISQTRSVISIKINITKILPVNAADEAHISFPASSTIKVVEKFIKNITKPKDNPLIKITSAETKVSAVLKRFR